MPIDLVISDLDGTILETEDYHRRAYNALFREMNLAREWSEEDYKERLATMGGAKFDEILTCLLYTSPSPRDATLSRMPSSA